MKKVVVGILAILGLFTILGVLAVGFLGLISVLGKPGVPGSVILEANFEQGTIETMPDDPLAELTLKGTLSIRDIVEALDRAAEDHRVKGLVARIGAGGMGMAHTQEDATP